MPNTNATHSEAPADETSTLSVESGRLRLDMPKSSVAYVLALLLGGSLAGGAGVSLVSDARIDGRVVEAIDKGLGKKLDEKMATGLREAREEATKAAAASERVSSAVEQLKATMIEQNARVDARASIDSNTRASLEAMLRDHESRLREVEREIALVRRR